MDLHGTYKVTQARVGAEPTRKMTIAALLARVANITTEALVLQYDSAGDPCPVMEHTKVGTDWAVWSVKNGLWKSVMADGTCVDDLVLTLIDRMTYQHSRDVEYLLCPPGTIQPAFLK